MRTAGTLTAAAAILVAAAGCDRDPSGPAPAAAVEIVTTDSLLVAGAQLQLEATVRDAAGAPVSGRSVAWSSTDTTRARVSETGLVTAVSRGPVRVVARSGQASDTLALRIVQRVKAWAGARSPMAVGTTQRISVEARDSFTNEWVPDPQVVLRSSDPAVVAVVDSTEVRAVGPGTATLTARIEDRTVTLQVAVIPAYTVAALPTLGGAASRALGVNERGDVVGEAQTASGEWRAFLYRDGRMTDVGPAGRRSRAVAVGADGTVVGNLYTGPDTISGVRPFRWKDGAVTLLPVPGDPEGAFVTDVNDRGSAVGFTVTRAPGCGGPCLETTGSAVLWEGTAMTDLGTLGGERAAATTIDEQGRIGGWVRPARVDPRVVRSPEGVLVEDGRVRTVMPTGVVAGSDAGHLAGLSTAAGGGPEVFVWKDGALERIGVGDRRDGGAVRGVNRRGEVVVEVHACCSPAVAVRVVDAARRVLDLQQLLAPGTPWELLGAGGITDSGQVVGWGRHTGTGEVRALVVSPGRP